MPLVNFSSLLHTYLSEGWNPDCENWTTFDSNSPVEFVHWGFLFGTNMACQQRPEIKILVMTCQQPLVKQAQVVCSNYVCWLDDRGVAWKGM